MPTAPQATIPINFSLRTNRPTNQLMAAPASGAKMIKRRRLLIFIGTELNLVLCALYFVCRALLYLLKGCCTLGKVQSTKHKVQILQFQYARIIHIQRLAIAKDGNDYSQPDRGFSCCHSHYNKNEKLARDVLKKTRESNERQIHCIEHQLDAHEHRNYVSLDHNARYADSEKDSGKSQVP